MYSLSLRSAAAMSGWGAIGRFLISLGCLTRSESSTTVRRYGLVLDFWRGGIGPSGFVGFFIGRLCIVGPFALRGSLALAPRVHGLWARNGAHGSGWGTDRRRSDVHRRLRAGRLGHG